MGNCLINRIKYLYKYLVKDSNNKITTVSNYGESPNVTYTTEQECCCQCTGTGVSLNGVTLYNDNNNPITMDVYCGIGDVVYTNYFGYYKTVAINVFGFKEV